jgi:hypothetical protein
VEVDKKLKRLASVFGISALLVGGCDRRDVSNNGLFWHIVKEPVYEKDAGLDEEAAICAKLLYGESGRHTTDAIEVMHVICNRVAENSKNKYHFQPSITEAVTSGEFTGYSPKHPITRRNYTIAKIVLDEWRANDCQPFCNTYYFVSGSRKGQYRITNQFAENADWGKREYRTEGSYCAESVQQYPAIKNGIIEAERIANK